MRLLIEITENYTLEDFERLKLLLKHLDALQKIAEHADVLARDAEFKEAMKTVREAWRHRIVTIAGILSAAILLRDQIREALRWFVQ